MRDKQIARILGKVCMFYFDSFTFFSALESLAIAAIGPGLGLSCLVSATYASNTGVQYCMPVLLSHYQ